MRPWRDCQALINLWINVFSMKWFSILCVRSYQNIWIFIFQDMHSSTQITMLCIQVVRLEFRCFHSNLLFDHWSPPISMIKDNLENNLAPACSFPYGPITYIYLSMGRTTFSKLYLNNVGQIQSTKRLKFAKGISNS